MYADIGEVQIRVNSCCSGQRNRKMLDE